MFIYITKKDLSKKTWIKVIKQKIFKSIIKGINLKINITTPDINTIMNNFFEFNTEEQTILLNNIIDNYSLEYLNKFSKEFFEQNLHKLTNENILNYIIDKYPDILIQHPITNYSFLVKYISKYPESVQKIIQYASDKIEFIAYLWGYQDKIAKEIIKTLDEQEKKKILERLISYYPNDVCFKIKNHLFLYFKEQNESSIPLSPDILDLLLKLYEQGCIVPPKDALI